MVFCNQKIAELEDTLNDVTILILIDGFLQYRSDFHLGISDDCHNPYFNRWFSAIILKLALNAEAIASHNPYFNRWFSAILKMDVVDYIDNSHNPYFNRWFSAIY